jgi:hypothetical protein
VSRLTLTPSARSPFLTGKAAVCETIRSPQSSMEVKNMRSCTSNHSRTFVAAHRNKFTVFFQIYKKEWCVFRASFLFILYCKTDTYCPVLPLPLSENSNIFVTEYLQNFSLSYNYKHTHTHTHTNPHTHIYRVSQEECARLRESVPYVKVYRYNPKYLYPKLNSYGDNGQRKMRSSCSSTYCTCSADALRVHQNAQSAKLNQYINTAGFSCAM